MLILSQIADHDYSSSRIFSYLDRAFADDRSASVDEELSKIRNLPAFSMGTSLLAVSPILRVSGY